MDKYDRLEKLARLKEQGTVSEEEYEAEKNKLLDGNPVESDQKFWGMELKTFLCVMHISQLASYVLPPAGIVLPIVMWVTGKDESETIDRHGKEIVNWLISSFIYTIGAALLSIILIGIPFLIALVIASVVFSIIGGIKANDGEFWPYPLTISFIK